jgi:hypothetical protein
MPTTEQLATASSNTASAMEQLTATAPISTEPSSPRVPPSGLYAPRGFFVAIWQHPPLSMIDPAWVLVDPPLEPVGWVADPQFGFQSAFQCEGIHHQPYFCYVLGPGGEAIGFDGFSGKW